MRSAGRDDPLRITRDTRRLRAMMAMMAKKSWRDQAEKYLNDVLNLLREFDDVVSIEQEPYKDQFFEIFSIAYRTDFCTPKRRIDRERLRSVQCKSQRPLISSDTIWAHAKKHDWVDSRRTTDDDARYRNIRSVMTWWDEWVYAWDRNPPPRMYHRKQAD